MNPKEIEDLNLGATGNFPNGKLNDEDEGELRIGITIDDDTVLIAFGKALKWVAFPPETAIELGNRIIENAHKIIASRNSQPTEN